MSASNPILSDPEALSRYQRLPAPAKKALEDFCLWLYRHSVRKADLSWARRKAPMAVYWSSVKAWSFHLHRVLRQDSASHPNGATKETIRRLLRQRPRSSTELAAITARYGARIHDMKKEGDTIEVSLIPGTNEHIYSLVKEKGKKEKNRQAKLL